MDVVRRYSLLASASLLGLVAMLGAVSTRPPMSASAATRLALGTRYFDSTVVLARTAAPRGARGDALTVSLGYLERLRVGAGDPFRLADEALHDPRVDPWLGERVSWALLGRTLRGDAYVIDPLVFLGADGREAPAEAQLALIERTVRGASDPRAGELAVRLAYLIAAGKGVVNGATVEVATEAAALVRDRELAARDVRTLLADASERREDVMTLLAERRASRAFEVERPALSPIGSDLRIEAMNAVPGIVRALDTLDRIHVTPTSAARVSILNARFASRLAALGREEPPRAQVVVTERSRGVRGVPPTNEETLVAKAALVQGEDSTNRAERLGLLASVVALRTYAQSTPWFVGDPGPDDMDLAAEFGLAGVSFSRSVPDAWRPYFRRELQASLRDMAVVFPAASFAGLRVSFGTSDLPDSALAMHDPRTRTLQLDVFTSSGTVAHELSHDLDYQTSRMLFAAGGYSTDRAMTEKRGPLAASVRGLANARLMRPVGASSGAMSDRPAELFARGSDWFVASMLALHGRNNGFLTAVQDASIAGYAAGLPSAVGLAGSSSLLATLDQMTFVPDSARAAFESEWSDPAVVDPTLVIRRVLETPISWRSIWQGRASRTPLPPAPLSACLDETTPESRARSRLFMLAVDARAQGVVARRLRYRPMMVGNVQELTDAARAAIVSEVRGAMGSQGVVPAAPASFRSTVTSCSTISR
ncbi:MAG TPA: hypothetical protein VH277_01600 [Gemmatimonadaceae bacterium]|jgi:hypothetical protein|nr:hypothetical protein [Gemmatimonadaceae bacterium]